MRIIKIGDKELGLRATPLALLYYKQAFKKDLIEDLVSFQDMADIENGDFSGFDSVKILQICYAMNKADNFGKQFPDFETWLSKLDRIDFADEQFMMAIIEEATDGFFRSAGAQQSGQPADQHRESGSESAGDREEDGVDLPGDE